MYIIRTHADPKILEIPLNDQIMWGNISKLDCWKYKAYSQWSLLAENAFVATPMQLMENHITYKIFLKCFSTEADVDWQVSLQ